MQEAIAELVVILCREQVAHVLKTGCILIQDLTLKVDKGEDGRDMREDCIVPHQTRHHFSRVIGDIVLHHQSRLQATISTLPEAGGQPQTIQGR